MMMDLHRLRVTINCEPRRGETIEVSDLTATRIGDEYAALDRRENRFVVRAYDENIYEIALIGRAYNDGTPNRWRVVREISANGFAYFERIATIG
jgi:hypothetical protein